MITCPICGAQNDSANRFCDQCGARMDTVAGASAETEVPEAQPAATTLTCPACGTPALPGQAFCDNCGYDLRTVTSSVGEAAPATTTDDSPESWANVETIVAPQGSEDTPTDQTPVAPDEETIVSQPPYTEQPTGAADAPPVWPDDETMYEPPAAGQEGEASQTQDSTPPPPPPQEAPAGDAPAQPATDEATALDQPGDAELTPPEQPATSPEASVEETMAGAPAPPDAAPTPPDAAPAAPAKKQTAGLSPDVVSEPPETPPPPEAAAQQPADSEEHERLKKEVETHQKTIQQMEQMLQSYPPDAPKPEFLTQGLEGARRALKQAEEKIATLPAPAAPDPARVAQLEQLINVHQGTIAQFEQMKTSYPPNAVPDFLQEGLNEAQQALTKAQQELAALRGETPPSAVSAPAAAETPATGAKGRPRLVLFDGKHEFLLPTDKTEFIVGREDPVSHIFPEIDLTSYGGEAGGVSRQHARLNYTNQQWTITDLNSTNHTRVNGTRLEPDMPTPIDDGTQIQFGRIAAVFRV